VRYSRRIWRHTFEGAFQKDLEAFGEAFQRHLKGCLKRILERHLGSI
jgi:hypothetical protein